MRRWERGRRARTHPRPRHGPRRQGPTRKPNEKRRTAPHPRPGVEHTRRTPSRAHRHRTPFAPISNANERSVRHGIFGARGRDLHAVPRRRHFRGAPEFQAPRLGARVSMRCDATGAPRRQLRRTGGAVCTRRLAEVLQNSSAPEFRASRLGASVSMRCDGSGALRRQLRRTGGAVCMRRLAKAPPEVRHGSRAPRFGARRRVRDGSGAPRPGKRERRRREARSRGADRRGAPAGGRRRAAKGP